MKHHHKKKNFKKEREETKCWESSSHESSSYESSSHDKCKFHGFVCPSATTRKEPPECEQRRGDVSGDVFVAANAFQIGFTNQLMNFNDITDNLNPNSCEGTFGSGWHLAPIEELVIPAVRDTVTEILQPCCPVLVWTTNAGIPTLAYVLPRCPDFIKIVKTPSLSCLAYHFCINSGG